MRHMQFLPGVVLWVPWLLKDFRKLTRSKYHPLNLRTEHFSKLVFLK